MSPVWRRRSVLCAVLLGLIVLALLGRGPGLAGDDFSKYHDRVFTVTNVVDGETFDIGVGDGRYERTRIRLWGVDTPEVKGSRYGAMHFGAEASAFAKETLLGRRVRILLAPSRSRDKYDRLLAYAVLESGGESYGELLLAGGLAYADWRFAHPMKVQYKALERRARRQGVCLWAQVRFDQMPLWRQRMERELGYEAPGS